MAAMKTTRKSCNRAILLFAFQMSFMLGALQTGLTQLAVDLHDPALRMHSSTLLQWKSAAADDLLLPDSNFDTSMFCLRYLGHFSPGDQSASRVDWTSSTTNANLVRCISSSSGYIQVNDRLLSLSMTA